MSDDINAQPQPVLLQLPPELRNMIYRHCLVEDQPINISSDLRTPSLLATCIQVRTEATDIWYRDNHFHSRLVNCDTSLLRAFLRLATKKNQPIEVNFTFAFSLHPLPVVSCWDNLESHSRAVHAGEIDTLVLSKEVPEGTNGRNELIWGYKVRQS